MAEKLKALMGIVPRKYQVLLTGIGSASIEIPFSMASAAALTPPVNTWLEVVSVTNAAGRLRGAIVYADAVSGAGSKMKLRVTVDGVAYVGEVTLGSSLVAYILLSDMLVGNNRTCLLSEVPFSSSLKIEVLRESAFISMTLNYFYQLEA